MLEALQQAHSSCSHHVQPWEGGNLRVPLVVLARAVRLCLLDMERLVLHQPLQSLDLVLAQYVLCTCGQRLAAAPAVLLQLPYKSRAGCSCKVLLAS